MRLYEKRYYDYQTQARGLLTEQALLAHFRRLVKWYRGRIGRFLPSDTGARCLDVPCGYGNFLYFLRERGFSDISGVDLDPKQVELAKMLGLPVTQGDAFETLDGAGESVDLVSSFDFLEHLDRDAALRFLESAYGALRPRGTLLLRVPCGDGPFGTHDAWNDLTHQWAPTSNVMRTLLEMHGYVDIRILDERPQPVGLVDTVRWLIFFPAKWIADGFCMALGMRPPAIWSRSMFAIARKPAQGEARN